MADTGNSNGIKFIVLRTDPVMVCPAQETPKELLYLSNIDDVPGLRLTYQTLHAYAGASSSAAATDDPALFIRDALSKALLYYYPLAGRLRKSHNGKLEVDCNGEGALFVHGTANCSLEDVEYLSRPTQFSKQLYFQFPDTYEHHDIPPLVIQVTRFLCGGYVLAFGVSHCMIDGPGFAQFGNALAQLVRGLPAPSVVPVWQRHLLAPRNPLQIGFPHAEFIPLPSSSPLQSHPLIEESFFIPAEAVTKLKHKVVGETNGSIKYCSRFEALAAFVWKCRAKALRFPPDQQVQLHFYVNVRKIYNPPLPEGYYGNGIWCPCISLSAQELSEISLGEVVRMIRGVKVSLRDEYLRSAIDLIELHRDELEVQEKTRKEGRASNAQLYLTDLTRLELTKADFGSGAAVFFRYELFQSPVDGTLLNPPSVDHQMKDGVIFVTCLPAEAVAAFNSEIQKLLDSPCDR